MKICYQRTDISQAVRMPAILPVLFEIFDVTPRSRIPRMHVPFVDAVDLSAPGGTDVFVGKEELAQAGIQRKSMNAVSGRVNHHRARAIDEIARSDLVAALLQAIFEGAVFVVLGDLAMDRKNGSDTGIDVDIG